MNKKLSGLDKALIFVAIVVVLFTISMIVIFWFKGDVPNVLITAVFGATFAECGFCSYIWKQKIEREEKQDESRIVKDDNRADNNDYGFTTVIGSDSIPKEQIRSGENEQASDLY